MKVLHLTLSLKGGAGIACRRLHAALLAAGTTSNIWASVGASGNETKLVRRQLWRWWARLDYLPLHQYRRRKIFAWWSNNRLPTRLLRAAAAQRPNILHLHWVGDGWIDPREIAKLEIPIVWTLHDAWALTGGCHYPGDCDRFMTGCGACPQLGSTNENDLSSKNFSRKQSAWKLGQPVFVAPSRWLAGQAMRSACARDRPVKVIPNGLDDKRFFPGDRMAARGALGLTDDCVALLVFSSGGMGDSRKGTHLIGPALARLTENQTRGIRLLVLGGGGDGGLPASIEAQALGRVEDEAEMATIYAAADAHVLPTLQDNLPNTALEAIACGCPVLGFAIGGLPEIVEPGRNGLLTRSITVEGLAGMLHEFLTLGPENRARLRTSAREVFLERFNAKDRAADYLRLYRTLASDTK